MLDIDHFKRINDFHGHLIGDLVLKSFASVAQDVIRKVDLLGRIGGEEFMLIMPATDLLNARTIVERFLDEFRVARMVEAQPDVTFTCSAGLAVSREDDQTESLFRRADMALYEAKQSGRDRLVCCDDR